jgi:uncharacterized protein (TIGR00369 family)
MARSSPQRKTAAARRRSAWPAPVAGGMPRALGVELVSIGRRRVEARMRVTAMHLNRSGRVNGGAIMAFADVLGAAGTVANLPPGHRTTTLESKTNFFAAGEPPLLTAVSVPLHRGRTTMVWQTTVANADGRRVAVVTQTQIVLPAAGVPAAPAPPGGRGRPSGPDGR